METLNKIKWATYRILFLILGFLCALTGGILTFIVGPLISYLFFRDINFIKYRKYFISGTLRFWSVLYKLIFRKDFQSMFSLSLTAPPMSNPDLSKVKLSEDWNAEMDDCNKCVKCCEAIECPLLDRETNLCTSYNSFFWRYFPCGKYPMSQEQIDFYGCPKWEMIEEVLHKPKGEIAYK